MLLLVIGHKKYHEITLHIHPKHGLVTDFSSCSLSERRILSSYFTSYLVNICRTLHHTWIDKKTLSPDPDCDSDASLPLISILQGQPVDRWSYEEW